MQPIGSYKSFGDYNRCGAIYDDLSPYAKHYGTPRHSGRYPWGSGENPYQRNRDFLGRYYKYKKDGLSDTEIAKAMNMTTKQLTARRSMASDEIKLYEANLAMKLKEKGYSNVAIGKRLGKPESTIRNMLDPEFTRKRTITANVVNQLKDALKECDYIDVGAEVERHMGNITKDRLATAVQALKDEGYNLYSDIKVTQAGTGHKTTFMVLTPPEVTRKMVMENIDQIRMPTAYTEDGGKTFEKLEKPIQISEDRIYVKMGEEGTVRDGLIEIRPGVKDLDLGRAHYAQVRIGVEGDRYMKGMAVYSDNVPPGYDVIYNSNKTDPDKVFKKMEYSFSNPDNPFGASIKLDSDLLLVQRHYTDDDGEKKLSAINIVNEEGNWSKWSKTLPSQMLSKQNWRLAKQQLDLSYSIKEAEFKEIMSLELPALRSKLLMSFADECDAAASDLKAAGMPGQRTHVLLPFPELKENQCVCPDYKDGTRLALIRFPHAGLFEIADVVVTNSAASSKNALDTIGKNAIDAIGINQKTAQKLSGADFDGDTVLAIPNNDGRIVSQEFRAELRSFDPNKFELPEDKPGIKYRTMQTEMGRITNLITDMTVIGAPQDEIIRAVKHSMVVIDSYKHRLDIKASAEEFGIDQLRREYQLRYDDEGKPHTSAATLLSKSTSEVSIPERKPGKFVTDPETGKTKLVYIDPETGKKLYRETGRTFNKYEKVKETIDVVDPETGKVKKVKTDNDVINPETGKPVWELKKEKVLATQKVTQMDLAEDANELSTGHIIETVYADYANRMKSLANECRKEVTKIIPTPYSKAAYELYSNEVESINKKLDLAKKNRPLERKAQAIATSIANAQIEDNPGISDDDKKKIRNNAIKVARNRIGAGKTQIKFTDKEWEALVSGAFRPTKLADILSESDERHIKERAMPRTSKKGLSPAKAALARRMIEKNSYTISDVAEQFGMSPQTLKNVLYSEEASAS